MASKKQRALKHVVDDYPCRGARRHWMEQTSPLAGWEPPSAMWRAGFAIVHEQCVRCGTYRHTPIDHMGNEMTTPKYDNYPEGYHIPKDEMPSRADIKLYMARKYRKNGNK